MSDEAKQIASGNFIAQARDHSNSSVTVYQFAPPAPVDERQLAAAMARLNEMPLDRVPEPAPLPRGSRMTLAHNPLFVGRQSDLLALARTLKDGATAATGRTAAATGLGGMGKTQLAAEFAHRYGGYFAGGVFWLSLASAESVPGEIAACGRVGAMDLRPDFGGLKQEDQIGLVLSRWQDGLPRLLVFDNCESQELLAEWRPPSGACRVLVTSRRADWELALGVQALRLDVLPRGESVALLRSFRPDLSDEDSDLDAMADELGDLPLALHVAGSYLRQYVYNPAGAPARLLAELRRLDLLEHQALTGTGESYSPTKHELSVARTFTISYDQLRTEDATDALAQKALANAACLAPGELIPRDLLLLTLKLDDEQSLLGEDALQRLASLGLLETEQYGELRLHRLLAAFVGRLDGSLQAVEAVEDVLMAETGRRVETGYPAWLLGWQAHLRWVARQAEKRNSARASDLYGSLGGYLRLIGDYAGSREAFERALTIDEAIYGPDHPAVATDVSNLGLVMQELGDLAGARAAFERALTIDEAAHGLDHPTVAIRVNNLGLVLRELGDLAGARAAAEQALKIDEAVHGPDHSEVATDVNNLGLVLRELGDLAGARAAFERALKIDEAVYGPDNPTVGTVVNNLGLVLWDSGDLAGGRAAFERALTIDEVAYGPDHPDVARDVNNLGSVLRDLGDLAGARAAFERALKIDESAYGPNHPTVASRVNSLGMIMRDLGDLAGARAAFERALTIHEVTYGPDHPDVARDVNNLGMVLRDLGDPAGARAAFERALKMAEAVYGPDHTAVATAVNNLGLVLGDLGDPAGARAAFERALRILEKALGPDHPNTQRVRQNLDVLSDDMPIDTPET